MTNTDHSGASRQYWIRSGYAHATEAQYYDDKTPAITFQPDVYALTFAVARRLGAKRVIDVGCGQACKLSQGHPEFAVVGIDFGANIEYCRRTYEFGRWLEHDLGSAAAMPVADEDVSDGVVVCSDVIEHVVHPERLLGKLSGLLAGGSRALLISTPERDLVRGLGDPGPPRNRRHLREWSIREFDAWLEEQGFGHRSTGLTRSDDHASSPATILTLATGAAADLALCKPVLVDFTPGDCTPKPLRLARRLRVAARILLTGR